MTQLEKNIRSALRSARKRGTVGMSFANLKQIVPTRSLTCTPAEFHRDFPVVAKSVAADIRFNLYEA
ncbi:MAG: hypothetical protein ACYS7Y_04485 [Planctomycetota bacterium]